MNNLIKQIRSIGYREANTVIRRITGIVDYFASEIERIEFISSYDKDTHTVSEDRVSYGDWQTPISLAEQVCEAHISRYGSPDIVIEPTCGLGAFVFSSLKKFPNLSEIHAIEINSQYTAELKLNLLINALNYPSKKHTDIYIYNRDFFKFDFSDIVQKSRQNDWNVAIIGNPPWVTNSSLGRRRSDNHPVKRNNYGLNGIDAITGKSNFDISEFITLHLLELSHLCRGGISFLLKNSVIRNILIKQQTERLHIGDIEQRLIDASTEFNASVEASCFSAGFNRMASLTCEVKDFYSGLFLKEFGWVGKSFVSDIKLYGNFAIYDNFSSYVWRSGIKHDCSAVLELTLSDNGFINGLGEVVEIEDDMIYPLLKSSDIDKYQENGIRKYIIVPQRKTGFDTSILQQTYPLTYAYLMKHEKAFANRKSSIYRNKDKFSIFGIGDYSFSRYKIVISSLYKNVSFKLISQIAGKPVIVDDTCYQLDFNNPEEAKAIYKALCCQEIQSLLKSLIFKDAKRVVTKGLLMRLDLVQVCKDKGIVINSQRFANQSNQQLSLFD